jgi:hypothetical protein
MRWPDVPWNPPQRQLRQFAGLWLLFFGGLGCWQELVRDNTVAALLLAILALTVGPLGLWKPQAVRPIFVGWMILAFPIGWVVSHVVLAFIFYAVFTPVGLLFRLIGRDALQLRRRPELESYWLPKPAAADVRDYFRQF